MRQAHGSSQKQVAELLQNRIAISAALPVTVRRADGGGRTPETWIKELYASKNRQEQNQNLPMSKNQKHRHGGPPRPPVGRHRKHQKSSQKGTTPQPSSPLQFQDHLVLETKPHFRIIIRLENARFARGLGIAAHWTWSKSEAPYYPTNAPQFQYLDSRPVESTDRTQVLTINGTWDVPFGTGRRWLANIP
jgi:hypothetical protein